MKQNREWGSRPGEPPWSHGLEVKVVTISPALAKDWLTLNEGNRPPKNPGIAQFARDMTSGAWALTGEAIIFDSAGALRNGQNRLMACIESGASFVCLVVWGVRPDAFQFMDRGNKRTIGDVLHIKGEDNASALAAACGFVWRLEQGRHPAAASGGHGSGITVNEALDVLERHPDLRDSVTWRPGASVIGLVPTVAIFLHWWFAQLERGFADVFFDGLIRNIGLDTGNPILTLQKSLRPNQRGEKLRSSLAMNYTVKAWNVWGAGKSAGYFKMVPGEKPPVPQRPRSGRWVER